MRRRELLRKLIEIKQRPWQAPWFPSRADVHKLALEEAQRLRELAKLLPEIIDKLSISDQ